MLLTLLILIGLVLVAMIATRIRSQETSGNRYKRKKSAAFEPRLSSKKNKESKVSNEEHDADAILGLKPKEPQTHSASLHSVRKTKSKPSILVLSLVAPNGQEYSGYELLQAILATGLRYGDMKIFHRHEEKNGRGAALFSMASLVEPGTFDLPAMGSYQTPGMSFFLCYDRVKNPRAALDLMIDTIQELRDELGGEIIGSNKEPVNKFNIMDFYKTIDEYTQTIGAVTTEEVS